MPELPEVETIGRQIGALFVGNKVINIELRDIERLRKSTPINHYRSIKNTSLTEVKRQGKYLNLRFDGGNSIISHLGMSGKWQVKSSNSPSIHVHAILSFTKLDLIYIDPRKFGQFYIVPDSEPTFPEKLGVDFLDKGNNAKSLYSILKKRNIAIKSALMDQSIVSGIGNIYANEILFEGKLHPTRPTGSLREADIGKLVQRGKSLLRLAIKCHGTTLDDGGYSDLDGEYGKYQNYAKVHGRSGYPCKECGEKIRKDKISSRTYYYCPKCQK